MTTSATLDPKYNDKSANFAPGDNCPGFDLWDVLASDGKRYLMAGDYAGAVDTRLYFRAELDVITATKIGPNPAVALWEKRDEPPVTCTHTEATREHLDTCCADHVDCDLCGKPINGLTGLQLRNGEAAVCTDCLSDDRTEF